MIDCSPYIELLRQMVSIPSLSKEEGGVTALLSSALDSMGIDHKIYKNNIIALNKSYSADKKTLALDAHIDTVPAAASYTRNPFDAGDDSDIVYGLGSNDDGGSVVAMIAAFRHFYDQDLPFNLMLSLSGEEECSGPDGATWLYAPDGVLKTEGIYPDWAIIGEPTGLKAATSERGLLVIDAQAQGVSGHAARNEGVNAIYIALKDIETLRNHRFEKISEQMGEVRLNITQIQAGKAHNIIPDTCSFVVDIRPTDEYTNTEILGELQSKCESTLKARKLTNRSSASKKGSPLLKTIESLGIETFSSPTTSNWIRMDLDAIKMGPGESSRSHQSDEYILTSEIARGIETYIRFIDNFYGNTLE